MPLYEYYCGSCDGIFEALRTMREAGEPAPCPVCNRDAQRIMPTSFAAFTMRDGLPRRIPDRGTYWHLGKEVKHRQTRGSVTDHPELRKPTPPPTKSKGGIGDEKERGHREAEEHRRRRRELSPVDYKKWAVGRRPPR